MSSSSGFSLDDAVGSALDELGDPSTWVTPTGYPSSLVLCAMDSIWSIGIRYDIVISVIDRYLRARGLNGLSDAESCLDTPQEFLDWLDGFGAGRVEALTEAVNNRNRTSSRSGVLKAAVMIEACELLVSQGIQTSSDLLTRVDEVEPMWRQLHGQKSGISWRYLLMLAGFDGIKPDRMLHRFLSRHQFPKSMSADEAVGRIAEAIEVGSSDNGRRVTLRMIDHRIWLTERFYSSAEPDRVDEELARFVAERDWGQFHSVRNLFIALVGEVGELAELLQWRSDEDVTDFLNSSEGLRQFSDEVADIYLYLLRIAQVTKLDINEVALRKIAANELRYPLDVARGSSVKYSDRR